MLLTSALLIGSLMAAHYCRALRDRCVDDGQSGTLEHLLAQGAIDVSIPLAVVAALYLLLTICVDLAESSAALVQNIALLEAGIGATARWLTKLKLGVVSALAVLVVCFAASVWLRHRGYQLAARAQSADKTFERLQKSAKALATVATLTSAFTLFTGYAEATQRGRLSLRLKHLEAEYHGIVDRTSDVIEETLSLELARRAYEHAPAEALKAGQSWNADRRARQELAREYEYLSERYKFSWARAEELRTQLQHAAAVRQALDASIGAEPAAIDEASSVRSSNRPSVLARSSQALLEELKGRLGADPADNKQVAAGGVLDDELRKKIIPKLVSLLLDQPQNQLTALAAEVPLLEPLIKVASGTVTARLGAWIHGKARALVHDAIGGRRFDRRAVEAVGLAAAAEIMGPPWDTGALMTQVSTAELETRTMRAGLLQQLVRSDRNAEAELKRENAEMALRIRTKWPADDLARMPVVQRVAANIRPSSPEPLLAEILRRDVLTANAMLRETEEALGRSLSGLSDLSRRYDLPAPARGAIEDVLSRRPPSEVR